MQLILEAILKAIFSFILFVIYSLIISIVCSYLGKLTINTLTVGKYPPEITTRSEDFIVESVGVLVLAVMFISTVMISDIVRFGL